MRTKTGIFILLLCCVGCVEHIDKAKDCVKVGLTQFDFARVPYNSLPPAVKQALLRLATVDRKMDTALSLNSSISYSYSNPGNHLGYVQKILHQKDMHLINGQCYEFAMYKKPYIVFEDKLYCMQQDLILNCAGGVCTPDTAGLRKFPFYVLSLAKVLKSER